MTGGISWEPGIESGRAAELTKREREIMTLVARGLHGEEMAAELFLSPETVKTHVQHAMAKLGVHTRAHAVAVAWVTGQISWEINDLSAPLRPLDDPPPAG